MQPAEERVEVRRAEDRFRTRTDWLDSRHSFSFGVHYDPDNVRHGALVAHNDDTVTAGGGYDAHPHRDMEIVTWVLEGGLRHEDSTGNSGLIYPGLAQRLSAGTGIRHSERNADEGRPVHFVQMWVLPDESGLAPGYEQQEVGATLAGGQLVPVASGTPRHRADAAVRINNRHATLHAARLPADGVVRLPEAAHLHLFVARGAAELETAGLLAAGDAVRLTASGGQTLRGAGDGAEVLLWEMGAD